MLRTVSTLAAAHPIELSPTFMGAHEIPSEYRNRRRGYVDLIVKDMLPAVAREGLAEWCDVFCETGVFTPDESREILEAGRAAGLKPRIHADELGASGGAKVAAEVGARSADHLIFVDEAGAAGLAAAGTVATLLPIASFYLKLGRFAPARMLIERGVAVALATDVNPGAGYSPSMPFAMALACFGMNLTFEEALVGGDDQRRLLARSPGSDRQPRARQTDGRRGRERTGDQPDPRRRRHHSGCRQTRTGRRR